MAFVDRITVPFAPETSASGIGWKGPLRRAWYRRSMPAARPGLRTVLHLGAVDRCAEVWVGGAHVASHEGGYIGFAVDVTDYVADGADLVVRADDDPADLDAPRGKQDWRDKPHQVWYPRTTGIWHTGCLEHVAPSDVAELAWDGDPVALEVGLRARLSAAGRGSQLRVRVRAGDRLLVALLWWPSRPVLLDAEVTLLDAAGDVLDEARSYTALRHVGCEDGAFLLNGRPLPLRLVLDQGYWPHTGATPPDAAALPTSTCCAPPPAAGDARRRTLGWYASGGRRGENRSPPRGHPAVSRAGERPRGRSSAIRSSPAAAPRPHYRARPAQPPVEPVLR